MTHGRLIVLAAVALLAIAACSGKTGAGAPGSSAAPDGAAANLNSPNQTVISGAAAAVEKAMALCKARGARRAVPLSVSAPFHCALMQPAQEEVARVLAGLALHDPSIAVAANVTGGLVSTASAARDALVRQVTGAVRWVECVYSLEGRSLSVEGQGAGADVFIEVGPGKVLCGLLKQIDPGLNSLNVEDAASLERTRAELKQTGIIAG